MSGALLECAEMFVCPMPSRLIPLSTFSKQLFAVVVEILSLIVDVIKSFMPEFRMMFGGRVRSLTESFLASCPMPLSLCSESGGDGVQDTSLIGDKLLLL
jgi:hypothetical protein